MLMFVIVNQPHLVKMMTSNRLIPKSKNLKKFQFQGDFSISKLDSSKSINENF
jgi:hypothetical protein